MKMNCWLMTLGLLVAVSATAQDNTNALPPIPAPVVPAPVTQPAAAPVAEQTNAPAKKPARKHKKHTEHAAAAQHKSVPFSEPTITLVPGPAEVCVDHVNVRGQAGLKGEVISHVQKGETVVVLSQINLDKHKADEPAQWAKIALPASTKVWVRASFIDPTNNTVIPKKLNLRGGPSEDYSVLGTIERGTVVTQTESKNGWIKIEAPTNSYAFLAAMYLKQEASGTVPVNPAPSTETPAEVETNVVAPAPTTVTEAQPIMPETATNTPPPATAPAPEAAPVATDTNAPAVTDTNAAAETDTNLPPPPPRVVTHEGKVRHVTSLIEPTAYELFDPKTGLDVDYLYTTSTNLDLSKYNGLHIIVTGEEGMAERWNHTPVLTVQKILVVE